MWIDGLEKKDELSTTQTILKTAVWKEGTGEIADKRTSGGMAVSGSAIGPVYVRIPINSSYWGYSPERLAVEGCGASEQMPILLILLNSILRSARAPTLSL